MPSLKIPIASDHAGFPLKQRLLEEFSNDQGIELVDLGPMNDDRVDYPDFANLVAQKVAHGVHHLGVLVCGSGQGMAIRANRYPEVRAALCWSPEVAQLSRAHNNANILCMGSRLIDHDLAIETFRTFLSTEFEGGRHEGRVAKLSSPLEE